MLSPSTETTTSTGPRRCCELGVRDVARSQTSSLHGHEHGGDGPAHQDPGGVSGKLVAVVIDQPEIAPLIGRLKRIDLRGLDAGQARWQLLDELRKGHRPTHKPASQDAPPMRPFPGNRSPTTDVLHLGDLRITATGECAPGMGEALDRDIRSEGRLAGRFPDAIVVSGGLTEDGAPEAFEAAAHRLEQLRVQLGIPPETVALIPGFSDIDLIECESHFAKERRASREPEPPHWPKFGPYAEFFRRWYAPVTEQAERQAPIPSFERDPGPWSLFALPELEMAVIGVNTVFGTTHLDDDEPELGDEQRAWWAQQLLAAGTDTVLVAAMAHRPDQIAWQPDRPLDIVIHAHPSVLGAFATPVGASIAAGSADSLGCIYNVLAVKDASIMWTARQFDGLMQSWKSGDTGELTRPSSSPGSDIASTEGVLDDRARFAVMDDHHETDPTGRHGGRLPGVMARPNGELDRDSLLGRVARATELQEPGAKAITRRDGDGPEYLRVEITRNGALVQDYPVGVCEYALTADVVDAFAVVHRRYHRSDPTARSRLAHNDKNVDPEVRRRAEELGIELTTYDAYLTGFDLAAHIERQTAQLSERRGVYPPSLYVPQKVRLWGHGEWGPIEPVSAFDTVIDWLAADRGCFGLLLGEFGTGKTFLLREVARRMSDLLPHVPPLLISLRELNKTHDSVGSLLAQHLANQGSGVVNLDALQFRLEEGRLALLFDGFDELANRVTYDSAAEHLDGLIAAAAGRGKVLVTSRSQHFPIDNPITRNRSFLVKWYGAVGAAEDRLALMSSIEDLSGLAANPRLLAAITDLPEQTLTDAAQQRGEMNEAELYRVLLTHWLEGEQARAARCCCPMAATRSTASVDELARQLEANSIDVAQRTGMIRASPHFYNRPDDISRIIKALNRAPVG